MHEKIHRIPSAYELIDDDVVLTPADISELLGIHVETVRRWCRTGKLRIYSPTSHYRIKGCDLKEFISRCYR